MYFPSQHVKSDCLFTLKVHVRGAKGAGWETHPRANTTRIHLHTRACEDRHREYLFLQHTIAIRHANT